MLVHILPYGILSNHFLPSKKAKFSTTKPPDAGGILFLSVT